MVRGSVWVNGVVSESLELIVVAGFGTFCEPGFHHDIVEHLERVGIQEFAEVTLFGRRILYGKESVVVAHLGAHCVRHRHPMQRTLHLSVGSGASAERVGVILGVDFLNFAIVVLFETCAFDDVGAFKTHLFIGREAEELLGGILHEVITFDPEFASEGHSVLSLGGILGIVIHIHLFGEIGWIIGNDEFDGVLDHTYTRSRLIEVFADRVLEEFDMIESLIAGLADTADEVLDR